MTKLKQQFPTNVNNKVLPTMLRNAENAQHVNFPQICGKGCPYGVGVGGVRWGVSEFLQVMYTKS